MQPEPPQFIDPLRLASQGAEIAGRLAVSQLPRLRAALSDDSGEVEYSLEFGRDAGGVHCILGHLAMTVNMQCQRCMQPMPVALAGEIRLGIVQGEEQARQLDPAYEPLLVDPEPLGLAGLVEDEALLLLPFAPLHEHTGCAGEAVRAGDDDRVPETDTHRPFAGLDDLWRGKE